MFVMSLGVRHNTYLVRAVVFSLAWQTAYELVLYWFGQRATVWNSFVNFCASFKI